MAMSTTNLRIVSQGGVGWRGTGRRSIYALRSKARSVRQEINNISRVVRLAAYAIAISHPKAIEGRTCALLIVKCAGPVADAIISTKRKLVRSWRRRTKSSATHHAKNNDGEGWSKNDFDLTENAK